jgi:drug/metabolite transporter (DMT)-like permease
MVRVSQVDRHRTDLVSAVQGQELTASGGVPAGTRAAGHLVGAPHRLPRTFNRRSLLQVTMTEQMDQNDRLSGQGGVVTQGAQETSGSAAKRVHGLGFLLPFILLQQTMGALCFPISKYGLALIEPFTFAFFRFILASVVLLILARVRERGRPVEKGDIWRMIGLGAIIIPGNQAMYLWGQSLTAAGHGAILFATTPIWVFLLAGMLLGEKLTWQRGVGIVVALSGALLIITGGAIRIGSEYLAGDLIILVSVWSWAAYTVLGKPLVEKYGALRTTAYALASGSAIYFPFGLYRALSFDYSQATGAAWLSIVYMAIGSSVISYILWYWFLNFMEASRLAVFQNVQPIIATLVALVFLGEVPGLSFLIGGGIVLVGVLVTEI